MAVKRARIEKYLTSTQIRYKDHHGQCVCASQYGPFSIILATAKTLTIDGEATPTTISLTVYPLHQNSSHTRLQRTQKLISILNPHNGCLKITTWRILRSEIESGNKNEGNHLHTIQKLDKATLDRVSKIRKSASFDTNFDQVITIEGTVRNVGNRAEMKQVIRKHDFNAANAAIRPKC